MTCDDCTCCNEDITVLQNLMTDARARGKSGIANGVESALRNCSNLERKLKQDNCAYLENIARLAKSDTWPEPEPQETRPRTGFIAQLEAARGIQNTPTTEHTEPEIQPTSVFRMMLEASRGHRFVDDSIIHRKIDSGTNQSLTFVGYSYRGFDRIELWRQQDGTIITKFPESPPEPNPPKTISRGYGFAAMLEAAHPSPSTELRSRAALDEKSSIQRGIGFRAMLEASRRGTE